MARRKRLRSASPSTTPRSKHRVGYRNSWQTEFPWHVPVYDTDNSETDDGHVVGLLCSLCKKHHTKQRNSVGTWTDKPCSLLRKDVLKRHKLSNMHKEAEELETVRLASQQDGGIRQAFSARVIALVGALKMMYWIAKQEIAHTTKFNSLRDLAIELGCDFLRELNLGKNAQYSSEQIISELLQCLSMVIDEEIILGMKSSNYFSIMTCR